MKGVRIQSGILNVAATKKRLGLGPDRAAERKLAEEIARTTDPYVPFRLGPLKNTRQIMRTPSGAQIRYVQPYARIQYYRIAKKSGSGRRGPRWFDRSKADNKEKWLAFYRKCLKRG